MAAAAAAAAAGGGGGQYSSSSGSKRAADERGGGGGGNPAKRFKVGHCHEPSWFCFLCNYLKCTLWARVQPVRVTFCGEVGTCLNRKQ